MSTDRTAHAAPLEPDLTTVKIEYGSLYSGGSILIRPDGEEAVYPLAQWIKHHKRNGGHVLRRAVHVVDDWREI